METSLTRTLGMKFPIIGAPLGGGPGTPELAAAVSEAGGLGTVAAAYLSPAQIDEAVARTRALTKRPFAINLFVNIPKPKISKDQIDEALAETRPYRQELGLADPVLREPFHQDVEQQFAAVLRARPRAFSFIFGMLSDEQVRDLRSEKIFTIGTATQLSEALELEASGVDAVIAQGVDGGAHRGIFDPNAPDPGISTFDLTRTLSARLKIPVIAAGNMMNGEAIARAIRAGAQAAMLGTAFLLCPEAGTSAPYRQALREASRRKSRQTRVFSGRIARGLENRFMREMESRSLLPFPAQNALTRDLRTEATRRGNPEFLSLWAGLGVGDIREIPASELMRRLIQELQDASK